jgi:hypothetical protein
VFGKKVVYCRLSNETAKFATIIAVEEQDEFAI